MIRNSMACLWNGLQRKFKQLAIKLVGGLIGSGFNMSIFNQFKAQLAASLSEKLRSKPYSISEVEYEKLLSAWQKRQ